MPKPVMSYDLKLCTSMHHKLINLYLSPLEGILSFLIGIGLLLSISTNLRLASFPVGPGEAMLALLACLGWLHCKPSRLISSPLLLFWLLAGMGMSLGAIFGLEKGSMAVHHTMAYAFAASVTVGLVALLSRLSDKALLHIIYWLCIMTAITLWAGFAVYVWGNVAFANMMYMVDAGDARYSGWSINPNQLALFFVPLPVWVAALWRDVSNPTRLQMAGFGLLLFALMLMGLLVRSDGLFVVWVFEFFVLIGLRLRWEKKASRMSLLGYALVMVLCVYLVKTFAQGEMRKSVRCAIETISQAKDFRSSTCYSSDVIADSNKFRVGYWDPVEKTGVRQELWNNGLQKWYHSPWLGFGPG
jgi:hypothetical protein